MLTHEKAAPAPARTGMPFSCLGLLLIVLSVGLLAAGIFAGYRSWQLSSGGHSTESTVVEMIESDGDDGVIYAPIVEYEPDGNTYRYESHNYSGPPAYHVGQQVKMLYDADHPEKARISGFLDLWLAPALLIPFGVGSSLVTAFLMPMFSRHK